LPETNLVCEGDEDKDGIPNYRDECPRNGTNDATTLNRLLAPNGCPTGCFVENRNSTKLICPSDKDGDGVPDDVDQCPDSPNIGTPDGCPPMEDMGHMPPEDMLGPQLSDRRSFLIQTTSLPACIQGALGVNGETSLLWQENGALFSLNGTFSDISLSGTPQKLTTASDSLNSTCSAKKGVALLNDGSRVFVYSRGAVGDRVGIFFQKQGGDGSTLLPETEITSFPTPQLGNDGQNNFVSVAASGNGFIVAWTDRDRVKARRYSPQNDVAAEINPVNDRNPLGARRINPDIIVNNDGGFTIVWQEGEGASGPLKRADFQADGQKAGEVAVTTNNGLRPSVASGADLSAVVWSDTSLNIGSLRFFQGQQSSDANLFSFISSSSAQEVLLPIVQMDSLKRTTLAWVKPETAGEFGVYLLGMGDPSNAKNDVVRSGLLIGKGNGTPSVLLMTNGTRVVTIHPKQTNSLEFNLFQWR
jgi:hypothetical protein